MNICQVSIHLTTLLVKKENIPHGCFPGIKGLETMTWKQKKEPVQPGHTSSWQVGHPAIPRGTFPSHPPALESMLLAFPAISQVSPFAGVPDDI